MRSLPIDVLNQMLRLRMRGMSYHALTLVLAEYHDRHVSADNLRSHLRFHGVPRDESRVRSHA